MSTSNGSRWRIELKNALLPHLKKKTDLVIIDNLLRHYVPGYFIPKTKDEGSGKWYFSNNIQWKTQEEYKEIFGDIENIGKEFSRIQGLNDKSVKKIFKDHKWIVNWPVPGVGKYDKRGRWKCDAYKEKVAVEVELSSRSQIFKDSYKFLIGQAMGDVEVGIIIVRQNREGSKPYFGNVDLCAHPIFTTLPMLRIAFYGFYDTVKDRKTGDSLGNK